MRIAADKDCTGCMACVDACRHGVLQAKVDGNGYYAINAANPSACVECGLCTRVCPILNPHKQDGMATPYAAWNTQAERRKLSASGGIFAAIASVVLQRGGVVYGAAIEGFDVRHRRITDLRDLHLLQGSKYQHSDMTGVHEQVRQDLRQGLYVLFSGLGCQVAGLLSFLGKIDKSRLYTIDTICGGLSTMLPMQLLRQSGKYSGIRSFRDKENGWQSIGFKYSLKMVRNDGSIDNLGLDNLVLNTFSSKLLKRSSCLDCQFTGFHRDSDCTIGDFWGDSRFKQQHAQGLSIVIIHNCRIMQLIEAANMELQPITWPEAVASNKNIYWTHYPAIRHFWSRKIALNAMRRNDVTTATKQMATNTFPGLLLRIYLKINNIQCRLYFQNIIQKLDK